MGHSKKKKGTGDHREIISDIKRQQDQDAIRTALQPTFEGTLYVPPIINVIDYVFVTETTGASQG